MSDTATPTPLNAAEIDLLKLEIERDKLAVERDKLAVERYKAKFVFWSVTLPVLAAALAFGFNSWAARQTARSQFQLQTAKYLMESEGPVEVWAKAQTFHKMFPDQLPENFGYSNNPDDFMNYAPSLRKSQNGLFQILAPRCKSQTEVITLYGKIFPLEAGWLNETFKMHLPEPETTEDSYQ